MRVRTELRKKHILEVAARVFLEHGFERTSMSTIAEKLGGSKATLYGYFPSKEELFVEITTAAGRETANSAFAELNQDVDFSAALRRFGEKMLAFLLQPATLAAHRMVLANVGQSGIARCFYEHGPKLGMDLLADNLKQAMARGQLRSVDPVVAAAHLAALLESELVKRHLFGIETKTPSPQRIRKTVERAVDVFMAAYGRHSRAG